MDLVVDAMAKLFSVITGKTPRFKVSMVAGSMESFVLATSAVALRATSAVALR